MNEKINQIKSLARVFTSRLPYVDFFVTARCNLRCKHCFYARNIRNSSRTTELTFNEIKKISKRISKIYYLTLTGGEPTLREDIIDIIKIFYKQNDVKILAFHSNGYYPEKLSQITKEILRSCPRMTFVVSLSFDGFESTHDNIRCVKGSFNKLLKSVEVLRKFKREPNFEINLNTTLLNCNKKDIFKMHKFAINELGIPHEIGYLKGDAKKTMVDSNILQIYKKISKIIETYQLNKKGSYPFSTIKDCLVQVGKDIVIKTEENKKNILPCQALKKSVVINEQGYVFPCEILNNNLGNLKNYDYDTSRILTKKETKDIQRWIKKSKCTCTWECMLPLNIIFSLKGNIMLIGKLFKRIGRRSNPF